MTLAELYTELNEICQTARGRFREAVEPPYILYLDDSTDSIGADYLNLAQRHYMSIILATDYIDNVKEGQIEEIIKEYEYTKTRLFIESENLWQTTYEFELLEGGLLL